jgi:hypothetical protein
VQKILDEAYPRGDAYQASSYDQRLAAMLIAEVREVRAELMALCTLLKSRL